MSTLTRRERQRIEVRNKILDAARLQLAEHGKQGFTMRKIAAAIEYSPTVIYSHFKDKDALLRSLAEQDNYVLTDKMNRHGQELNPVNRLRLIGKEIINFALENPNHYLIFMILPKLSPPRLPMHVVNEKSKENIHSIVVSTVCEAIQQKHICSSLRDAELIAQTFFAGIHGVITLGLNNKSERINKRSIEDRLNLMIELLIRGLTDNRQTA